MRSRCPDCRCRAALSSWNVATLRHANDALAADYVAGKLTVSEIASKHRCNETTVYDIARSRGLRRATSR